jgi:hypothetical protein
VRVEGNGIPGFRTAAHFFDQLVARGLEGVDSEPAPGAVEFVFAACAFGEGGCAFARSYLRIPCVLIRIRVMSYGEEEIV